MAAALALAGRGLGDTWPNPAVGCVIVNRGRVVGRGWTQSGGRPHAEAEALARAGEGAAGGTAYVTLEPCSHQGRTPPCADALVAAGIARAVIAARDPDPRVDGSGVARLRESRIAVDEGVGGAEARALNRGFFLRVTARRPLFTLKVAASLDGRIALASGESRWITGTLARDAAQLLRARHDAVLVGSGTVLADDPALTCRLPGYRGRPKVRVVLDRRLRLRANAQLVRTASAAPTWIVTGTGNKTTRDLEASGATVVGVGADTDEAFAVATAQALAARGLTRVLIEGGGTVAASFLAAGLVDEIAWFSTASALGGDGRPAVGALGLTRLADAVPFERRSRLALGDDVLDTYVRSGT